MAINPLKTGLFAARYFMRPGEETHYADTLYSLNQELAPQGILEETFAMEIMGAIWRLHRCRTVEASFTGELDPLIDEKTALAQKSVDRARAQSHLILRRSMAELRTLQAQRPNQAAKTEAARSFCNPVASPAVPAPRPASSFCNPPATHQAVSNKIPRNAPCPLPFRRKIQEMLRKSGSTGTEQGRLRASQAQTPVEKPNARRPHTITTSRW